LGVACYRLPQSPAKARKRIADNHIHGNSIGLGILKRAEVD
jgi:hypothetical protein